MIAGERPEFVRGECEYWAFGSSFEFWLDPLASCRLRAFSECAGEDAGECAIDLGAC